MADSWRLKLTRAEHHLADIEELLSVLGARGPHPHSTRVEEQDDPDFPVAHFLDLSTPNDEMLPVLAGDFLFNIRSALDHLAVSRVPPERKRIAQYPIFTKDPTKGASNKGKRVASGGNADLWERYTKGMSRDVLAYVTATQPYRNPLDASGSDPSNHALAILAEFQNADKHRSLILAAYGLSEMTVTISDDDTSDVIRPTFPADRILRNGTQIASTQKEMRVEVVGSLVVAMGSRPEGAHREIPATFHQLLDIATAIADRIETL